MTFRKIQLSDRTETEKCARAADTLSCDDSFVNMYIWADMYDQEIAFARGFMFRRGPKGYRFPLGSGDTALALADIAQDAGGAPVFEGLTQEQCAQVQKYLPQINYDFIADPQDADYIYARSALAELSGKKYHAKRNFINRFKMENAGEIESRAVTEDDFADLLAFNRRWCSENGCVRGDSLDNENCAIRRAFGEYGALGLRGWLVKLGGRTVAYSLASALTDRVADVHVEKAEESLPAAYPFINNEFVAGGLSDFEYINREEDMGLPGLKKAKESYHPEMLLMRYTARGTLL